MDWKDLCETAYNNGKRDAVNKPPCEYCSGEYNQEFMTFLVRRHDSTDATVTQLATKFCPNCGRILIPMEEMP